MLGKDQALADTTSHVGKLIMTVFTGMKGTRLRRWLRCLVGTSPRSIGWLTPFSRESGEVHNPYPGFLVHCAPTALLLGHNSDIRLLTYEECRSII